MVRFLESQGFKVVRARGSHHVLARGSTHTTVPEHGKQTLRMGTLRGILRDRNESSEVHRAMAGLIRLALRSMAV